MVPLSTMVPFPPLYLLAGKPRDCGYVYGMDGVGGVGVGREEECEGSVAGAMAGSGGLAGM